MRINSWGQVVPEYYAPKGHPKTAQGIALGNGQLDMHSPVRATKFLG